MALKLPVFEDDKGNSYNASYWRITEIHINVPGRSGHFTLVAHRDQAARTANKTQIASRGYSISGDQFDAAMAEEEGNTKSLRAILYDWVKTYKDVPTGEWTTQEPNTPNARPVQVMVSFFKDAVDV